MSQTNLLYGNASLNEDISDDQKLLQLKFHHDKRQYLEISEYINQYGLPEIKAARSLLIDLSSDINELCNDPDQKQVGLQVAKSFLRGYRKSKREVLDVSDSSLQQLTNTYLQLQLTAKTVISQSLVERCQAVFRDSNLRSAEYIVILAFKHQIQKGVSSESDDIVFHLGSNIVDQNSNPTPLCNNKFAEYLSEYSQPLTARTNLSDEQLRAKVDRIKGRHEICKQCLQINQSYQKEVPHTEDNRLLSNEPTEQLYLRIINSEPLQANKYLLAASDRLEEDVSVYGVQNQQLLQQEYLEEQLIYELVWANLSNYFAEQYLNKNKQLGEAKRKVNPDDQQLLNKYQQMIIAFENAAKMITNVQCYDYSVFKQLPKVVCL